MKIILKQDVKALGYKDDVVVVKNGYANNFLIPKGMAAMATSSALKVLAENLRQAEFKREKLKATAADTAAQMNGISISIGAKSGANGKIFGSVTSLQISQALKTKGFEVDRRKIVLDQDIKNLGQYTATVNLLKEVSAQITVDVVSE